MLLYFLGDEEAAAKRKQKLLQFESKNISKKKISRVEEILGILTEEIENNILLKTYDKALQVATEENSDEVKIIWCAKKSGGHHKKTI